MPSLRVSAVRRLRTPRVRLYHGIERERVRDALPHGRRVQPASPAGRLICLSLLAAAAVLLVPSQAAEASVSTDGLVGYWKLDETSGTSAAESSGHSDA